MENKKRHEASQDEVIDALKSLRPAASKMDPSTVFYQAGFQAGQKNLANDRGSLTGSRLLALIASAMVAVAITAPASYRIGKAAGRSGITPGVMEVATDVPRETETIEADLESPDIEGQDESQGPAIAEDPMSLFARWMNRWQPSRERPSRDDQAETLSVIDASRFSQTEALQSWPELAFPDSVLRRNERELQAMAADNGVAMQRTFAVRDTNLWAQVLEVSR